MLNGEKWRHALRISFTSQKATREGGAEGGRENLHAREGDQIQIYITKQKEPRDALTCGSIYKWTGGTVHRRSLLVCLAQQHGAYGREREREMVSGLGTGTLTTPGSHGNTHEKGREMQTQPHPRAQDGDTQRSPLLSQRGLVGAHRPAHHMLGFSVSHRVWQWSLVSDQVWRQHGILKREL